MGRDGMTQHREALRKICDLSQLYALHRGHPAALSLTIVCPVEKQLLLGKEETSSFSGLPTPVVYQDM